MFGIDHRAHWHGEELHLELDVDPGFDWLGLGLAVALLAVALTAGAWATVVADPEDDHRHEWAEIVEAYQQHGAFPSTFGVEDRRCARQRMDFGQDVTEACHERLTALIHTRKKWYWDRERNVHVHVDRGAPGSGGVGDSVLDDPIAAIEREVLGFDVYPAQVVLGFGALGLLVARRRSRMTPISLRVRPGRVVVDGHTFDRVELVDVRRGRLLLVLESGRVWRSRPIKPVDSQTLGWLRQAATAASVRELEVEAARQLSGPLKRGRT